MILCPAYATVRFVVNQTVRQDFAVKLYKYFTLLYNDNNKILEFLRKIFYTSNFFIDKIVPCYIYTQLLCIFNNIRFYIIILYKNTNIVLLIVYRYSHLLFMGSVPHINCLLIIINPKPRLLIILIISRIR